MSRPRWHRIPSLAKIYQDPVAQSASRMEEPVQASGTIEERCRAEAERCNGVRVWQRDGVAHREPLDTLLAAADALAALREERDRLREALEDIARRCEARSELYTSDEDMAANLISHARATLAATGEE